MTSMIFRSRRLSGREAEIVSRAKRETRRNQGGRNAEAMPIHAVDMLGSRLAHLVLILIAVVLALFAGLLPMSSWRTDYNHDFGLFRLQGWSFFFERLFTWSLRPFSEVIAGLYHLAILETGRQLITPFLAGLWATLLIGPIMSARRARLGRRVYVSLWAAQ